MNVDTSSQYPNHHSVSRRDFLKATGISVAALASGKAAQWGVEHITGLQERLARLALAADVKDGKFGLENQPPIYTLGKLHDRIIADADTLSGVTQSQVLIYNGKEAIAVHHHSQEETFLPASTIKVVICQEAWKMGLNNNVDYLTPELAHQILGLSWNFKDLVMQLPFAQGQSEEDLELLTRKLLSNAGVPPINPPGQLPLRVNFNDMFGYLVQNQHPDIILDAMKQTPEKRGENYGVPDILLNNLPNTQPAFFKIGLIYDYSETHQKLINSYYLQIGANLKVLGYSRGSDVSDVHEQMLQATSHLTNYAVNRT